MRLRFTPAAIRNLTEIADYFHQRNPMAGRRVRADIYGALHNLLLFPNVGRQQTVPGVRKFVTRRYAYIVYYTVEQTSGEIVVLNLKHPSRRRNYEDR